VRAMPQFNPLRYFACVHRPLFACQNNYIFHIAIVFRIYTYWLHLEAILKVKIYKQTKTKINKQTNQPIKEKAEYQLFSCRNVHTAYLTFANFEFFPDKYLQFRKQ
jgi:hypothetical protein